MSVVALDARRFGEVVDRPGIVLIECHAGFCGACATFDPVYAACAERHPAHTFATIDVKAERALAAELEVHHVPTLLVYRDGILLLRQPGTFDAEQLEDIVSQAESLDMDLVRAELSGASPEAAAGDGAKDKTAP